MPSSSVEEALRNAGTDISRAASVLWDLDDNRLQPGVDYQIDVQERAIGEACNEAPRKLFQFWSEDIWKRTTFLKLQILLNKHDSRYIPEYSSDEELAFILSICQTPCIRFLRRWLIRSKLINQMDSTNFSAMLFAMWFTPHPGLKKNTTGFQHVFCGDLKQKRLSGLHNYVRVFLEERRGSLHYMGYVNNTSPSSSTAPLLVPPSSTYQLMSVRFKLHGCMKRLSSMFVGVSPEFEIALYTLLFLARRPTLPVRLGPYRTVVKVLHVNGKIRVAYPILLQVDHSGLEDEILGEIMRPLRADNGKRPIIQADVTNSSPERASKRRVVMDRKAPEIIDLNAEPDDSQEGTDDKAPQETEPDNCNVTKAERAAIHSLNGAGVTGNEGNSESANENDLSAVVDLTAVDQDVSTFTNVVIDVDEAKPATAAWEVIQLD